MGYESAGKGYSVVAEWNPVSENFTVLNEETAKGKLLLFSAFLPSCNSTTFSLMWRSCDGTMSLQ